MRGPRVKLPEDCAAAAAQQLQPSSALCVTRAARCVHVSADHFGATPCELHRDRPAETVCSSRHDHQLALMPESSAVLGNGRCAPYVINSVAGAPPT